MGERADRSAEGSALELGGPPGGTDRHRTGAHAAGAAGGSCDDKAQPRGHAAAGPVTERAMPHVRSPRWNSDSLSRDCRSPTDRGQPEATSWPAGGAFQRRRTGGAVGSLPMIPAVPLGPRSIELDGAGAAARICQRPFVRQEKAADPRQVAPASSAFLHGPLGKRAWPRATAESGGIAARESRLARGRAPQALGKVFRLSSAREGRIEAYEPNRPSDAA